MNKDISIFLHPIFGLLGILCAVWFVIETLNASQNNAKRVRLASYGVAVFIILAWIFGGYWYVNFYGAEKAIILKGPWPFAHNLFMEIKEHLFFITLILSLYLPIVAVRNDIYKNYIARKIALTVSALIIITALSIEGAGAVISNGVKVALLQQASITGESK